MAAFDRSGPRNGLQARDWRINQQVIFVSLIFLFVYLFGAYAYGAATVYGVRQMRPVWGEVHRHYTPSSRQRIDRAGLALFVLSTVWFVLHILIEFRNFTGYTRQSWLDLAAFIVFLFPPVIMHTVYAESQCEDDQPPPIFRQLIGLSYVVSPAIGLLLIASIFELLPRPADLNAMIGIAIGGLFTWTSAYSTLLMMRRKPQARTADQLRLRNVMVTLFNPKPPPESDMRITF